jgi:hypothetical protein
MPSERGVKKLTDTRWSVSRPLALPSTCLLLGAIQPVVLLTGVLYQATICCGSVQKFVATIVNVGRSPTVYVFTCWCLA